MTHLSESDVIQTSPYTEIKFNAPRVDDREMLEELIEVIKICGVKNTKHTLRDINEALQEKKPRFNLKLKRRQDA